MLQQECSLTQIIQNAAARVLFNKPEESAHHTSHKIALVANSHSHQIQGTDVYLHNNHFICTPIHKFTYTYVPSRSVRSASQQSMAYYSLLKNKTNLTNLAVLCKINWD